MEIDGKHVNEDDLATNAPLSSREQALLDGDDGEKSWKPTRKWWSLLASGVASIAGVWLESGQFDAPERAMLAALLLSLATTYFVENDDTPGGVPVK